MMVIEHTNATAATPVTTIFPADRCTWRQVDDTNGYSIDVVLFYPGNTNATDLTGTNLSNRLGYIGKSGRFVAISN